MLLKDIKDILSCKSLTSEELLDIDIKYCFGADLMSDVLRFCKTGSLLLTGLTNAQVIHVSDIMDLKGIIFVRGKEPDSNVIAQAEKKRLPLLTTTDLLFDTCGILYEKGLRGGKTRLKDKNESRNSLQSIV